MADNPASTAASILKTSPGTAAMALAGLVVALLAVEAAKWGAGKVSTSLRDAKNRFVAPPASVGGGTAATSDY